MNNIKEIFNAVFHNFDAGSSTFQYWIRSAERGQYQYMNDGEVQEHIRDITKCYLPLNARVSDSEIDKIVPLFKRMREGVVNAYILGGVEKAKIEINEWLVMSLKCLK